MGVRCRSCDAGLEHCHGTAVRHSLRHWECTDPDCAGPELVPHLLVVDCDVTGCGCDQPIGSAAEPAMLRSSG